MVICAKQYMNNVRWQTLKTIAMTKFASTQEIILRKKSLYSKSALI